MSLTVVNKTNCFTYWSNAQIAATNAPFNANWRTSPGTTDAEVAKYDNFVSTATAPILSNVALKGGVNAIRVFIDLFKYTNASGQIEHDITTIGKWVQANPQNPGGIWDNTTIFRGTSDGTRTPRYKSLANQIDNLLTLCADRGIGLILSATDYYSSPAPRAEDNNLWLWGDANLQTYLINFWISVSKRWGQSPALIGYELLNEPAPPGTYASMRALLTNGGSNYKGLMEQCIASIRVNDQATPIIVSSPAGGSPVALDFFFDTDNTNNGANLIKDPGYNRLVYTCHMYSPFGFCNQGVYDGNYHSLGTLYPNIRGVENRTAADGTTSQVTYDFATNGMSQVFANVQAFRTRYNRPVFLGEFSASSANYYAKVQNLNPEQPFGALAYASPTGPSRGIYGLFYVPSTNTGYIALRQGIPLYDLTEQDASGVWRPVNRVDITITAANGQNIGPFNNLSVTGAVFMGNRRWLENGTWQEDQEFLVSFAWPSTVAKPTQYLKYGNTDWHGAYKDGSGNVISQTAPFVDSNGTLLVPSGLRSAFSNFPKGQMYGYDDQHLTMQAPDPVLIGSLKIVLSPSRVAQQEAARVTFARDILRQCASIGMSWAWFCENNIIEQYQWGDKFWQLDFQTGKLRALLKRAAFRSIE